LPSTTATATRICRILYYGPPRSGKRANLAQIQASLPQEHRLAMATDDPTRAIAFQLRNGNQGDWQVTVQAMDIGQEPPVSSGARPPFDGIVFVCDSRGDRLDESLSAMEGLKTYLDHWHLDIMSLPMVLQYNRRDGDDVQAVDRLESLLNPWGLLAFPAAATAGEGVRETLKAVLSLTISHLLQKGTPDPVDEEPRLAVDPNPPVPGTEHTPGWEGPPADEARPSSRARAGGAGQAAIVVPVEVPRSALGPSGTGRIILEVQVVDD
jgi:hypothetical protein